jgi:hypothetical protein
MQRSHKGNMVMTKQYSDENRGALFSNKDRKETADHPDYTGNLNIDGNDYWLSAWLKKSKKGMTFMSLAARPKNAESAKETKPEFDDRVPF